MSFFLQFPSGVVNLEPGEDNDLTSRRIAKLLIDEPWVQLRVTHAVDQEVQYTQWTVMTRDEHGVPESIVCRQFDGSLTLLNNGV